MTTTDRATIVRLWALSLGVLILLVAVGYGPTRGLAGASGVVALLGGCGAAAVGAMLAAVPLTRAVGGERTVLSAWGRATVVRFVSTLGMVAALMAGTRLAPEPLLIWAVLGYLALLATETVWLIRAIGEREEPS